MLEIGTACPPHAAPDGAGPLLVEAVRESREVTTGRTAFNQRHPVCAARPVAASPLIPARQGGGTSPPPASPTIEASASTSLARHEQANGRWCT